jgi:hypothetical protein
LVSLILQAAGGAITSIADADQYDLAQDGINIMIVGLASQVASLALFMVLCLDFAWKVIKNPQDLNPDTRMRELRQSLRWKAFLAGKDYHSQSTGLIARRIDYVLLGLALATLTIFVRSVFRVAELNEGFHSSLANNQVLFMILEGAMIAIAVICMTILHPGFCFDGLWDQTKWSFRRSRDCEMQLIEVSAEHEAKA